MGTATSELVAAIVGTAFARQGAFDVAEEKTVRIAIPEKLSAEHVGLAAQDCEILQGILSESPGETTEILAAVAAGRIGEAREVAKRIGITEESFAARGGGMWAIILVAVACALLLEHD